jgi:hypothetical protein
MEICNWVAISLPDQIDDSNSVESNESGVRHHFIAIGDEELHGESKNAEVEEPDSLVEDGDEERVGH